MLFSGVLEARRRTHLLHRFVVLALGARGPRRRRLLLNAHLVRPVRLLGGHQCLPVAIELLYLGPRLRRVTAASGADRPGERRDRLRPCEPVEWERLGGRAERGRLAPAVL